MGFFKKLFGPSPVEGAGEPQGEPVVQSAVFRLAARFEAAVLEDRKIPSFIDTTST